MEKHPLTCCVWHLKIAGDSHSHKLLTQEEWTGPWMNRAGISLYLSVPHIPEITSTASLFHPSPVALYHNCLESWPVDCFLIISYSGLICWLFFSFQLLIVDLDHSSPSQCYVFLLPAKVFFTVQARRALWKLSFKVSITLQRSLTIV